MEESSSASEEYEIIDVTASPISPCSGNNPKTSISSNYNTPVMNEPLLNIANNGNLEDLESQLKEVMQEKSENSSPAGSDKSISGSKPDPSKESHHFNHAVLPTYAHRSLSTESNKSTGENNPSFQSNPTQNEFSSESGGGDYTIFNQILYLGAASINAPRSELEIQKNMTILNAQTQAQPIEVSVSIPSNSKGYVIVYDAASNTEIVRFKIHQIVFCANGKEGTSEACCFAFTSSRGDSAETTIFQCHVYRCQIPEAVSRVIATFVAAFHRVPPGTLELHQKEAKNGIQEYMFDISLEIKEEDSKGNFNSVPRDKECFKLRSNIEKQLVLTVSPSPSNSNSDPVTSNGLVIERCFGLLIAHGRRVKHADMNLLEMVSMGSSNGGDKKSYITCGQWDPKDPVFLVLNKETPKDMRVFMTVAIDLVIRGIQEPVRFVIETKVRVFPQNERFWYPSKKTLTYLFCIKIKQAETSPHGDPQFVVMNVENLGEIERMRPSTMSLSLNLSSLTSSTLSSLSAGRSPSITSIDTPGAEEDTDDDEPLLSGSGEVSKECPQGQLELWKQVLPKWQANPTQPHPKGISSLVKKGIPEALRGEVWQLLAGCTDHIEMMETYRVLIAKECNYEQVILRDINRTFPAHDYFKDAGGVGQESLYKISRAYSVYDEEVSYCQGTSFLSAALLLHMPEEQAFCILSKIMFEYGLRELFKDNFEVLHLRFFQLDRLMEEQIPEIWTHFQEQGIESHMFASQWFLTLYTAKFPLFMVFHYIDIFLLLGMDSVFQVALALLQMSKKELLSSDFEGVLKYFRVSLPKKYRNEESAKQLFKLATSIKVKRLKRYERDYFAFKEQEALREDPTVRLEKNNQSLLEDKMRLERENDDLAHELVTSKIDMHHSLDKLEDKCDSLLKEKKNLQTLLTEAEEEKKRLQLEAFQVKELLKKEVEKGDSESQTNAAIIADYKKICSQLSERLDKEQIANSKMLNDYKMKVSSCDKCSALLSPVNEEATDGEASEKDEVQSLKKQIKELEMELAKTKLALVESECKSQDLTHQLNAALSEIQASKNTWLQKTLTSISSLKERTSSTSSAPPQSPDHSQPPSGGLDTSFPSAIYSSPIPDMVHVMTGGAEFNLQESR